MYQRSWRAAFGALLPPDRVPDELLLERGRGLVGRACCLVAVRGEVLTGVAAGDPATGELEVCYLDPAAWGSGAGTLLLAEIRRRLEAEGARPWLWVWEGNARARRFYEREGWAHTPDHTERVVAGTSSYVQMSVSGCGAPTP